MKKLIWFTSHVEEIFMILLICVMTAVMGIQVFMRYIVNNSLSWAEEATRYLFVWFACMSIPYGIKVNKHLRIDMLLNAVPPLIKKIFGIFSTVLTFLFAGYLFWNGITVFGMLTASGQSSPAIRLPMQYVYLGLLVSLLIAMIRIIQRLINGKLS